MPDNNSHDSTDSTQPQKQGGSIVPAEAAKAKLELIAAKLRLVMVVLRLLKVL